MRTNGILYYNKQLIYFFVNSVKLEIEFAEIKNEIPDILYDLIMNKTMGVSSNVFLSFFYKEQFFCDKVHIDRLKGFTPKKNLTNVGFEDSVYNIVNKGINYFLAFSNKNIDKQELSTFSKIIVPVNKFKKSPEEKYIKSKFHQNEIDYYILNISTDNYKCLLNRNDFCEYDLNDLLAADFEINDGFYCNDEIEINDNLRAEYSDLILTNQFFSNVHSKNFFIGTKKEEIKVEEVKNE